MPYTHEEVKALIAFHSQYPSKDRVLTCEWCFKQKPLSKFTKVPTEIDTETGMAVDELDVCYDCLPPHTEPELPKYDEQP